MTVTLFPTALTAPHNLEAEQALLGCVMFDNAAFERLPDSFDADCFHEPFHGRLWDAICGFIRRGTLAEPTLLMDPLKKDPAFEQLGARPPCRTARAMRSPRRPRPRFTGRCRRRGPPPR